MGACFGQAKRWYYPRKPVMDLPTMLSAKDQEKVLNVWVEGRRKRTPIDQIIAKAGKAVNAPSRELNHFISIVQLQRVTPQMLTHLLGLMCKGDKIQIARLMFDMIDQDGSGELDRGELAELVRLTAPTGVYDTSYARRVAGEIMTFADTDRSGTLDWDEFLSAQDAIAHKLSQVLVESKRRQRFEASNSGGNISTGKGLAMLEHCGDWHSNNPNSAPFSGWGPKVTEVHRPPPKAKKSPKKKTQISSSWQAGAPESPAGAPKPAPTPPGNPLSKFRSAAAAAALLEVGGAGPSRRPVGSSAQNSSRDSTDHRGLTGCSPSVSRVSSMRRSGSMPPAATPDLPRGLSHSRMSGSRPPSAADGSDFGGPAAAPFGRRSTDFGRRSSDPGRRMSTQHLTAKG